MKLRPDHFKTEKDFTRYILECALRDRESYLLGMSHCQAGIWDSVKKETENEINFIKMRIARL